MGSGAEPSPKAHHDDLIAVGIAASAGGLQALTRVLSALPGDLAAGIMVVQHLSPAHPSYLTQILQRRVQLQVKQAEDGDFLRPGVAYIAPPDRHIVMRPGGGIALSQTERVHFVRPSADVLFASLAASYGSRALAVILSGSGVDGAAGASAVKANGGMVIVQDAATSEYFEMPAAAIETGSVDVVLPLDQIAPWIADFVTRKTLS